MAVSTELRKRFEREAQAVAALQHPNIVTIYSVEEAAGTHFLTMELVEGCTLGERVTDSRPHPEELCRLLLPLTDALAAAHAKGIIHRDLKPGNVMLTEHGTVKLLDFGVAKLAPDPSPDHDPTEPLTGERAVLGTPAYMSPEQLRGEPVDPRSDIFSLGILMYELVTGRHPFPAENPADTISSILRDAPPVCAELQGTSIETLAGILDRCLQKDPSRRYQTAVELREDLTALKERVESGGEPPPAGAQGGLLEEGRAALQRQAWAEAYDLLGRADGDDPLGPEDLVLLSDAAYWVGEAEESIRHQERAYKAFLDCSQKNRAGLMATNLAEMYFAKSLNSVASGWLKRAERLLEGSDTLEAGYLNRLHARRAKGSDPERVLELAQITVETGRRFGDVDLETMGLMDRAHGLVSLGDVAAGLEVMDEAMAAAASGELSPEVTGRAYCNMMSMCEDLADYQRAIEWSEVASRWCEPHAASVYPGICQVHRAGIMRRRGQWEEAEQQALRARELCKSYSVQESEAHYELGEIHLRRGDLEKAEEAFRRAHELGRDPVPGLALLRLEQNNLDAARELIERGLRETAGPLRRAQLLPARIEIATRAGEVGDAEAAVAELQNVVERFGGVVHEAEARTGRGLLLLQQGKAEGAVAELRSAWKTWNELELPYRGARTRLALGRAYAAAGQKEASRLELQAARGIFERLGARRDVQAAEKLLAEG
jgi:tetratricopeptide (TPR) repeat protein